MKLSDIRTELLEQHRQIRESMATTRDIALRVREGDGENRELHASLIRLADRVRRHNLREEELLGNIIPTIDAWGPVRAAIMTAEHIKEHGRLYTALLGIPATSGETAAVGIVELIALMLDHMDREEATFLNEEVLSDDGVIASQSDG
jgi:hemerythrin HHE cation binding domain-containing protein